jgi:hypothetical protein
VSLVPLALFSEARVTNKIIVRVDFPLSAFFYLYEVIVVLTLSIILSVSKYFDNKYFETDDIYGPATGQNLLTSGVELRDEQ